MEEFSVMGRSRTMSAFVVSDLHTHAIAQMILDADLAPWHLEDGQLLAELLRAENTRSVNYRYDEDDEPLPVVFVRTPELSLLDQLGVLECYVYQSCETPDYEETVAGKLVREMINLVESQLPENHPCSKVWELRD